MKRDMVQWSALRLGRRRATQAVLSRLFDALSRVAVGQIRAEASNSCPCSGPMNGGYCGSSLCSGSSCSHSGITTCSLTTAYCGSNGCWTCSGQTCCDCVCNGGGSTWYCYCQG